MLVERMKRTLSYQLRSRWIRKTSIDIVGWPTVEFQCLLSYVWDKLCQIVLGRLENSQQRRQPSSLSLFYFQFYDNPAYIFWNAETFFSYKNVV